ncbi:MAG: hypothetical protein GTN81_05570 [Proteobacteria bacterium]|nr:hypothetical protein [Pseudomonadota bacterium]
MEFVDIALDYLAENKIVAASILVLFVILLIKNFWFLIKLLVALALGIVAVSLVLSFVGRATKDKKDLLKPEGSLRIEDPRPRLATSYHHARTDHPPGIGLKRSKLAS